MNLGLDFRGGVGRLPSVLENLVARINTIWAKEHNHDGSHKNVTVTGDLVVKGDVVIDGDLSGPDTGGGGGGGAHAVSHQPGGADPMAVDAAAATGSLRTLGTGANQAAPGNDARFTAASTPLAHATTHQPGGSDAMAVDAAAATGSLRTLGTGANQAAPGNDARFTAPSTPTAHAPTHKTGGADVIKLDELGAPTDITTLNATTAAHGLLQKLPGGTATYLRADGTFAVPTTGVPGAHGSTHLPAGIDPIPNIALKNVDNQFVRQTFIHPYGGVEIQGSGHPGIVLNEIGQLADQRKWRMIGYAKNLVFDCVLDNESANVDASMQLTRTGQLRVTAPSYPRLHLRDNSGGADSKVWEIVNLSGTLYFSPINDAESGYTGSPITVDRGGKLAVPAGASMGHTTITGNIQVDGVAYLQTSANVVTSLTVGTTINATGAISSSQQITASAHMQAGQAVYAGTDFWEKGRSVPLGHWMGIAHVQSNFFAAAPMSWLVPGAAQQINNLTFIGNTAIWTVYLVNTATSGSGSDALYIALPFGMTGIQSDGGYCEIWVPVEGWVPGSVNVEVGLSRVVLRRYNKAVFANLGTTHIRFTLTFRTA